MNEAEQLKELADNLWTYFEPKIKQMLSTQVSYYKAEVTAGASDGKITVQRPFDSAQQALPYASSASGVSVGDQVIVLVFGDPSNAKIIGKTDLSNL